MATKKKATVENEEISVETRIERTLEALYTLQQIDSQIDRLRARRGELPFEVKDLEDVIIGLETRHENQTNEIKNLEKEVADCRVFIQECEARKKNYEIQQNGIRNNREYESLERQIKFEEADIQSKEKRIKNNLPKIDAFKTALVETENKLAERREALEQKKIELDKIVKETQEKETKLLAESEKQEPLIEERYLTAYKRIRKNARNGLAVVGIKQEACGGCNNIIPPQHQLDIRIHKKIIVCEFCGRILVDPEIATAIAKKKI